MYGELLVTMFTVLTTFVGLFAAFVGLAWRRWPVCGSGEGP